jgi:hypothetical protein
MIILVPLRIIVEGGIEDPLAGEGTVLWVPFLRGRVSLLEKGL